LALTFFISRTIASPFRGPNPVSTTSVALLPTMMPTFGTRPTLKSGIAQTCSVSFTVAFSRMSGAGGVRWPDDGCCADATATRPANVSMRVRIRRA
jgi:hypothetical protein